MFSIVPTAMACSVISFPDDGLCKTHAEDLRHVQRLPPRHPRPFLRPPRKTHLPILVVNPSPHA